MKDCKYNALGGKKLGFESDFQQDQIGHSTDTRVSSDRGEDHLVDTH